MSANPWVSERTGFDEVFDIFHSTNVRGTLATLTSDTRLERVGGYAEEWLHKYGPFSQWPTFYDEIVSLVERADDPYFLWIFLMDTHNPYIPYRPHRVESSAFGVYHGLITANHLIGHDEGSSYRETIGERAERNLRQAYRDCIRSVDRFVERVHRELAGDGDVLVFHADHGEAFGEHGTWGHLPVLYEENVSVPLLVHGLETTGVLSEQVSLIDFPSLLLDAGTCTSVDSVGVISERAVIAVADGSTVAVRDPPWKYVEGEGEALYDVTASEGENLAEGEQPRTARYRKHVEAHRKRVGVRPTNQHITDAPPPTQQLEALGYVDEDGD